MQCFPDVEFLILRLLRLSAQRIHQCFCCCCLHSPDANSENALQEPQLYDVLMMWWSQRQYNHSGSLDEWKKTKKSAVASLNDYCPVALTLYMLWETRNFFSTSKITSQPAWTLTSLHSEQTDPHMKPSLLPCTQSSHTLKIPTPTPTPECCLVISVQHSTQSPPWNWLANLALWAWEPHCNWILDLNTANRNC